jgi:hypothetical protein
MSDTNSASPAQRDLVSTLKRKRIATIDDLMGALQTDARMTVFRALKDIPYQTSYSHGGRYYALKSVMDFDEHGLWSVRSVWFSRFGTLMATLEEFVEQSDCGYFSGELESLLHVGTKESLLRLLQQGRVSRERILRAYLYCSKDAAIRKRQIAIRAAQMGVVIQPLVAPDEITDEVKAAIVLFSALLDERLRRLFAGIEALQFGRGAEGWIANLLGIHRQTVAKGRQQLLEGDVLVERIRKEGAGRPPVEKKARRSSKKSSS